MSEHGPASLHQRWHAVCGRPGGSLDGTPYQETDRIEPCGTPFRWVRHPLYSPLSLGPKSTLKVGLTVLF